MQIYQLERFSLAQGLHVPRFRLCHPNEKISGPFVRVALWANADDGPGSMAPALALPENRRLLLQLASVSDDSTVEWCVRSVGRAGALDLAGLISIRVGGRRLLMVAATGGRASPARLREQVAQAVRNSLSAMASIDVPGPPPWTKLVVLTGWRYGVPVPTSARPLPRFQKEVSIMVDVPEPQVWGFVPFARESRSDEVFLAVGRWEEFEEGPFAKLGYKERALPWSNWEPVAIEGYGEGATVDLEELGSTVRVSLRTKSSAHKAALKAERHGSGVARRIRQLRVACYNDRFSPGSARFAGETVDSEGPRLHWDWPRERAPSPERARELVIEALAAFDRH
ncbi:MAG: hypothetical protein R3B72_00225 [Polyangiaceae bacterium]